MMIILKSGFRKTEVTKQKIGKIIFSKILEMPLMKYLKYINKTTNELEEPFLARQYGKKKYLMQK